MLPMRYSFQTAQPNGTSDRITCSQVTSSDAERSKAEELRKQGHEVVETQWSFAGG
ncbi:MAG: hypothetical protein M3O41_07240 [Pseudomonadota bacterium]|nr:hypothetical protein [Pseudomonadota bacterium]